MKGLGDWGKFWHRLFVVIELTLPLWREQSYEGISVHADDGYLANEDESGSAVRDGADGHEVQALPLLHARADDVRREYACAYDEGLRGYGDGHETRGTKPTIHIP